MLTAATQKVNAASHKLKTITAQLANLKLQTTGYLLFNFRFEEEPCGDLPVYTDEELKYFDVHENTKNIDRIKRALKEIQPNLSVLQDYLSKLEIYRKRTDALEEATASFNKLKEEVDALKKQRLDDFSAGFVAISMKLKEMYKVLVIYKR
jgi:chromosome segregation ATPase